MKMFRAERSSYFSPPVVFSYHLGGLQDAFPWTDLAFGLGFYQNKYDVTNSGWKSAQVCKLDFFLSAGFTYESFLNWFSLAFSAPFKMMLKHLLAALCLL